MCGGAVVCIKHQRKLFFGEYKANVKRAGGEPGTAAACVPEPFWGLVRSLLYQRLAACLLLGSLVIKSPLFA